MKKISTTDGNTVVVDDDDYPLLSRLTWYTSDSGYAITDTPVKHLKMHRLIIGGTPPHTVIDHINRNKLDNRKENLRVVSPGENLKNSDRYELAKRYWYDKRRKQWRVEIAGITKYLPVKNPLMARRVVKRLLLGFPTDLALKEAAHPTIPITNWKPHNIKYEDYQKAKEKGVTIKQMRRKMKRKGQPQ